MYKGSSEHPIPYYLLQHEPYSAAFFEPSNIEGAIYPTTPAAFTGHRFMFLIQNAP